MPHAQSARSADYLTIATFRSHLDGGVVVLDYSVRMIDYKNSLHIRIYEKSINYKTKHKINEFSSIDHLKDTEKNFSERSENPYSEKNSITRTKQQIYKIVRSNEWEYFVTLTFNPKMIDSTDYRIVRKKLQIWLNNLKKRYSKDLKYFFVPEYHKDKRKLHFHGLVSNVGDIPFVDSGRVAVGKYAIPKEKAKINGSTIWNLPKWKYGFSTATKIIDNKRACSYITKYITKDMCNLTKGMHRYLASNNIEMAREYFCKLSHKESKEIMTRSQKKADFIKTIKCDYDKSRMIVMEFNKGVFKK